MYFETVDWATSNPSIKSSPWIRDAPHNAAHPLDQIPQAPIDLWPPYPISGFPTPERIKASAMPPQDGLRLNQLSHAQQARPEPGHGDEQGTVTAAKSKTRWCSPQSDVELMTEKQILSFKPGPRPE